MPRGSTFTDRELALVERRLGDAERLVAAHFRFSRKDWETLRYDVRTLAFLAREEITDRAMAQVAKYEWSPPSPTRDSRTIDFYRVCVQDHKVLEKMERDRRKLRLDPFLFYILTHELIHVVRFSRALQHFEITGSERFREECRVHRQTFECLREVDDPGLVSVLHAYRHFRQHALRQ